MDSFGKKLGSVNLDVMLAKRHWVLILVRILLAAPGPAFLVFSAIRHFEVTTATAGSAWSGSITQIETGRMFAIAVGMITVPVWILSLLIAQIESKLNEERNAQKFANGSRVFVKRSSGDESFESFESFGYVKKYDAKEQEPYTVQLESGTLENFGEAELEKKPAQKFANGSRVFVKRSSGGEESFGYVKEYDEQTQVYMVELNKIDSGTLEQCEESSMRDATPVISREHLVRLWNYFLSLWKWDQRIWTWPKAFEAALFWGCLFGYAILYQTANFDGRQGVRTLIVFGATPLIPLILYLITKIVRSIIDYQDNQNAEYHTFVNLQAVRLSILTIFGICLTIYALSAMSRVVIPYNLVVPFVELAYNDITCTDRDAFWSAFEASSANASCHALPNCGYASFESLCQAVQYAPMVQAESVDLFKVLLFNWLAWMLGSLLVFGTGRASLKNGYAQLLSKHMLVAMVLGLGQLMFACYSLMRLLLLVPMLRLPRPAAYFDEKGLMSLELPLYCYGNTCTLYDFGGTILVHVLIAVALNFDFLKKYASAIGAGDQAAIDKLKEKMRKEGEWSDEAPYFYFIPATFVKECTNKRLPPMQELLDDGFLDKIRIHLVNAFKQAEEEARLAKEKAAVEKAAAEKSVNGKDIGKGIDASNQAAEKEAAEKEAAEKAAAEKAAAEKAAAEKAVAEKAAAEKAAAEKAAAEKAVAEESEPVLVSRKFSAAAKVVAAAAARGERSVVFVDHPLLIQPTLEAIRAQRVHGQLLRAIGLKSSTKRATREEAVARLGRPLENAGAGGESGAGEAGGKSGVGGVTALVLTLRIGATGLNLDAASQIVFVSPCLDASLRKQAVARCYRMGQRRAVNVTTLAMAGTVEEDTLTILERDDLPPRYTANGTEVTDQNTLRLWALAEHAISSRGVDVGLDAAARERSIAC